METAKWENKEVEKNVICQDGAHTIKVNEQVCSHCGTSKYEGLDADLWSDWDIAFCPHCGAKIES